MESAVEERPLKKEIMSQMSPELTLDFLQ